MCILVKEHNVSELIMDNFQVSTGPKDTIFDNQCEDRVRDLGHATCRTDIEGSHVQLTTAMFLHGL